jgi:hypothetical protein
MIGSHFTREEMEHSALAIARGIENRIPLPLLWNLDVTLAGLNRVRAFLGQPVIILSGYRCPTLNDLVKGARDSQHMKAQAADLIVPKFGAPPAVAQALRNARFILGLDQLILEASWVHVSFTLTPRHEVLRCPVPGGGYLPWD